MRKRVSFQNLKGLKKSSGGLSTSEIAIQRSRYGSNDIVEVAGNPWLDLARETLKDPMIWFLLLTSLAFTLAGDFREAAVLFFAMLPLLFMDAILHRRIQVSTTALRRQLATKTKVLREGREIVVNSRELVPGDLAIISSGDYLPADGYFEFANDVQVDESALTGESFPVEKKYLNINPFELIDFNHVNIEVESLGYAGTRVLTGAAHLRVLFIGQNTSYGEIVKSVASVQQERTPLQISIANLVRILIFAAAGFCFLLAGIRIYQGHGWLDALLTSATLAVAAIPEEFPVVFTFFLGVGVYRLAKKRALVRRAVSVENIGRVTAICTDKTGTITLGQLKLINLDPVAAVNSKDLLKIAALASSPLGNDPVDQAIWEMVQNVEITVPERFHVFPYTEGKKREAAFATDSQGQSFCYMKGAPETVLSKTTLKHKDVQQWLKQTSEWAKRGHKVLACAIRNVTEKEINEKIEPENDFTFMGLLTFADPPRAEVIEAMSYCNQNLISVWMITGDHLETALAIANEVNLCGGISLQGISAEEEPEKFNESYLKSHPDFLKQTHVIARCTPLQKLEVVKALRHSGELVAVTGDGVNDVPALKASDIGIAMGEGGTRSAREVSSIILADDNFATIVNAIKEGRRLFLNLKKSFAYLLFIHIPLVLTAAIVPLLGYPLLYLPIHIVWLELIIHPTALFAFLQNAKKEGGEQGDSQFGGSKNFFSRSESSRIVFAGLSMTLAITLIFVKNFSESADVNHARTQALTLLIFWSAALVAYLTRLKNRTSLIIGLATCLSALLVVQTPIIAQSVHLSVLHTNDWIPILGTLALFLGILSITRTRK